MAESPSPTCITCGSRLQDPPVLNRRADGMPCPTCVERVLESVPPALPTRLEPEEAEADEGRKVWEARYIPGGGEPTPEDFEFDDPEPA